MARPAKREGATTPTAAAKSAGRALQRIGSVFTALNINAWKAGSCAHYTSNNELVGATTALETVALYVRDRVGEQAGVVGLQEIGHNVSETGRSAGTIDQAAAIADHLAGNWTSVYGRTIGEEGGRTGGNAALSNTTVEKEQAWRFYHDPKNLADYGKYPRGATAIKVAFPGDHKLWVVTTHLDGGQVSIRQLYQLLGNIKTFDPDFPTLVMGDMNIKGIGQGATPEEFAVFSAILDESTSGFRRLVRHSKVYIYLYDPHGRLEVLDAGAEAGEHHGIRFSDHAVVSARLKWN